MLIRINKSNAFDISDVDYIGDLSPRELRTFIRYKNGSSETIEMKAEELLDILETNGCIKCIKTKGE